jgi:DNA helicase HerA-like ATPase
VIVGAAGSGKTTTAKSIAAHLIGARQGAGAPDRVIVFDPAEGNPADEWRPAGATYVRTRLEYLRALQAGASPLVVKGGWREWSPLEQLGELLLVVDEAHRFATPSSIDPAFAQVLREGRHRRMDLVIATQRPSHLHPDVLANCTRVWIHPLQHRADRAALERGLGVALRDAKWRPVELAGGRKHATACHPLIWPLDFAAKM